MPAKIQKKSRSKKSFSKKIISIFVVIFVLSLSWLGYRSMMVPTDINLVSTKDSKLTTNSEFQKAAPAGCYYKQVQCIQAPCPEQLICDSTTVPAPDTESGRICTQEAGLCVGNDGSCVTYTDGCAKSKICSKDQSNISLCQPTKPTPQPGIPANCTSWFDGCNTCSVVNGKIAGCTKMACKVAVEQTPYCKAYAESTKPIPTSVPTTPPVQPTSPVFISSFEASEPCNSMNATSPSFKTYLYTCVNGIKHSDSFCRSFDEEMVLARNTCKE